MIQRSVILIAILIAPLTGRTEEEIAQPKFPPPYHCLVKAFIRDGEILATLSVARVYRFPKESPLHKHVIVSRTMIVDGTKVKVTRKDGKFVDPKLLPTLLRKKTKVLLFKEGKVDPYYLDVARDQVLIITIPTDIDFPGWPYSLPD